MSGYGLLTELSETEKSVISSKRDGGSARGRTAVLPGPGEAPDLHFYAHDALGAPSDRSM